MTLQEFCGETVSVAIGSSHYMLVFIDKVLPGWLGWIAAHVCAVCVALYDRFRR
jgi:hypothetical protein